MIPAAFDFVRAGSAEEAVSLLGEHGDEAKLIAGGHSLIPLMRFRLAAPSVLVDIGRLDDLKYVTDGGDHLKIGALTRHDFPGILQPQSRSGVDGHPRQSLKRCHPEQCTSHSARVVHDVERTT